MTTRIAVPNTHALYDPNWARAIVDQYYRAQFGLYFDLVRYAADLTLRALASAPDGIPHHMVLSILFRQAIAAADAVGVLLQEGAIDQAHLQLRALVEARWGLHFALRDPEKWGRHIYVSSLREQRHRAKRWIRGTPEYDANLYERELRADYGSADSISQAGDIGPEHVQAVDAILNRAEYADISSSYDAFFKRHRYEGPWYFDGSSPAPDQITSIRKLAVAVDALGEYDSVYKYASDHTHGGQMGTHLSLDERGAYIAHIRTPEGLRESLILSFALLSDCCRRVIEEWRPDERQRFVQRYVVEWRGLLRDCPDVSVERSHTVNR